MAHFLRTCLLALVCALSGVPHTYASQPTIETGFLAAKSALLDVVDGLNGAEVNAPLRSGEIMLRCFDKKKIGSSSSTRLKYFVNASLFIAVPVNKRSNRVHIFLGKRQANNSSIQPEVLGVQLGKNSGGKLWANRLTFKGKGGEDFTAALNNRSLKGKSRSLSGKERTCEFGPVNHISAPKPFYMLDGFADGVRELAHIETRIKGIKRHVDGQIDANSEVQKLVDQQILIAKELGAGRKLKKFDMPSLVASYEKANRDLKALQKTFDFEIETQVATKPQSPKLPKSYQNEVHRYNFGFASKNNGTQKPRTVLAEQDVSNPSGSAERKAKEAEALRLAKLEEQRKVGSTSSTPDTNGKPAASFTPILAAQKTKELLEANAGLLRDTRVISRSIGLSVRHSRDAWNESWNIFIMHDRMLAFRHWRKGSKFVFGEVKENSVLGLKGYEFYKPGKKQKLVPITAKGTSIGSFIDFWAAGGQFTGQVAWKGWGRQQIKIGSGTEFRFRNHILEAKVSEEAYPEGTLMRINARIRILNQFNDKRAEFERLIARNGVFNAKVGEDLTPLIQRLENLKVQLEQLIEDNQQPASQIAKANAKLEEEREAKEAETQVALVDAFKPATATHIVSNCQFDNRGNLQCAKEKGADGSKDAVNELSIAKLEEERKAKEAEALRLAKLEEERKAREAEALRLAKLEEERKAKEAEALRLAKLEKERKAKEAESLRLAKLEEERKAKEAEARRLAKLEEERRAKEAEALRLAKIEEERKAKEAEARRLAEADKSPPKIFAEVVSQDGYDALIRGVITDDTGLQDIAMNGQLLDLDGFGVFEESMYIPRGGKLVTIEAIDKLGKLARFELKLERRELAKLTLASFEELTPSKRIASSNDNAVAIIIGIAQYQRTEVPAIYADQDANYFYDYAALKLGVPERNIIDLVNENANAVEIFLATENFLRRKIQKDVTDVYIFYAGHGLATDDGSEMYLLPYDGAPQLLERTAISRKQLFNDIAASNPKSVTVFLDTCYSGTTRGTETLIASRPIAIKAKQQDIPEGFTVMTAAAGDQTAKPLEEAKHGMFSYFLMKGMEGDADANKDNRITAGELHAYVQQNVIQQSSGSQTPELQGDADRVLVSFQ